MHEVGIAASIIEAVRAEVAARPGLRAVAVNLRIGELAGVDPESLRFGFDALIKESDLDPLVMNVEYIARRQRCLACNTLFEPDRYTLECPSCGSLQGECTAGDELDIASIVLEDA